MENNRVTAVEWLESEFDWLTNYMMEEHKEQLFNQAKAMEKEQILKAFEINYDYPDGIAASERYYKRKYGSI